MKLNLVLAHVITLALVMGMQSVKAANLWWDGGTANITGGGDGASGGTAGSWNTTLQNWDAGASGHAAWNNANNDIAVFGGMAGVVTLGEGITAGGLQFDALSNLGSGGSYILSNSTLTLSDVATISGVANASISSILAGTSGLAKSGVATLTLNGSSANTLTGGLTLNGGTLLADFANMATSADLLSSGNTLTLAGGILSIKGKASGTTVQSLGDVTVSAGGGQILGNKNGGISTSIALGSIAVAAGGSLMVGNATTTAGSAPIITTASDKDAQGVYAGRIVFFNGTATTGYDFVTTASASSPYVLSAFSGYTTNLPSSGSSESVNYAITAGIALAASESVNTLKITGSSTALALGTNRLTIASGGLLTVGSTAQTISGTAAPGLTAGNGSGSYDLTVHQYNSGGLTISAAIGNNGGNAVNLVKAGTGGLILSGANTYSGNTYVNAGILDLGTVALSGFGGGSGRNIHVAAGAGVKRTTTDSAFLARLAVTSEEITIMPGASSALDLSAGDFPNAFLGNWANNGGKFEYAGTYTPFNNTYRLGSSVSSGLLGMITPLTDNGAVPRSLIVGGSRVELVGTGNTFSGDTVIRAGKLVIANNLALQNSALDLGSSGGLFALHATGGTGPITGSANSSSPTFGGLKGSRNLLSAFTSSVGNNENPLAASAVTGFTLNVGAGKSCTYSGVIANFTNGTTLAKTGAGTQILSNTNTYTGATTISAGMLMGVTGGGCPNSAVSVASSSGTLGVSVTVADTAKQWFCASLTTADGAKVKFVFDGEPSLAMAPPLKITGDLTFTGIPTVELEVASLQRGKTYPLLVAGTLPSTLSLPALIMPAGLPGSLEWDVPNKTLNLVTPASGSMVISH